MQPLEKGPERSCHPIRTCRGFGGVCDRFMTVWMMNTRTMRQRQPITNHVCDNRSNILSSAHGSSGRKPRERVWTACIRCTVLHAHRSENGMEPEIVSRTQLLLVLEDACDSAMDRLPY